MSSYNSEGPSGLSQILVYMTIGTVAYMMVCGTLVDLILIALGTMVGLWAANIIAGR